MNFEDTQERTANAGEYVVGTLTPTEKAAFEARLAQDRDLQAEVYAWQDQLLSLNQRVTPMAVRPELWHSLMSRLGVSTPVVPPLAVPRAAPDAANEPVWRSVGFWRATSAFALAASVVMGTALLTQRLPDAGAPAGVPVAQATRYLAVLQGPDKATGWVVEAVAGDALRLVPVGDTPPVPEGKTLQFWTKPEGAKGPTSLGLVKAGQTYVIPVSALPGLGSKQLFELTLEPAGGSTIGRPTGPVLFIGRTVQL